MQLSNASLGKLVAYGCGLALAASLLAQISATPLTAAESAESSGDVVARIREEGLSRSQVMEIATFLCDNIGPRLTGSSGLKRANEWTRDKLTDWGLTNAHLEAWGPFGYGWTLKRFSAQVVEPYAFPLIAAPKAWSPSLLRPLLAEAVYLEAANEKELEKYQGKLKGAAVLVSSPREVKALFEPPSTRLTDADLLKLANAVGTRSEPRGARSSNRPAATNARPATATAARSSSGASASSDASANTAPRAISSNDRFQFAVREGAALIVSSSPQGEGGTLFVSSATVPAPEAKGTNTTPPRRSYIAPWATNAAGVPAQITLCAEDYHRLVHLTQRGPKPMLEVDLQARFETNDVQAYNTLAELPGGDLKEEIVLLGAHLDSWHAGTGATDDAAGVAVVMEAARILKTLQLQPRRTIRVALWSGEEQGLLGSKAYVASHLGYYTNATNSAVVKSPKDQSAAAAAKAAPSATRKLVRQVEYDHFSAYFNFDNGSGKIRGVYLQGNDAVRPLFRQWLEPVRDLGADTLTLANTGGTDHLPFDWIGLPAFQFIQDPLEYGTRTHHSNADVLDRLQAEDLKQAAVVMAVFTYRAAMLDDKLPRGGDGQ